MPFLIINPSLCCWLQKVMVSSIFLVFLFPKPQCFVLILHNKQVLSLQIYTFLFQHEFTIVFAVLQALKVAIFTSDCVEKENVLSYMKNVFPDNVLRFLNWNVWVILFTRDGNRASTLHLHPCCSPERSSSGNLELWAAASPLQLQMFNSFPMAAHSGAEEGKKRYCWVLCCMATRWAVPEPTHLKSSDSPTPDGCPRPLRGNGSSSPRFKGCSDTCCCRILSPGDCPSKESWGAISADHHFSLSQYEISQSHVDTHRKKSKEKKHRKWRVRLVGALMYGEVSCRRSKKKSSQITTCARRLTVLLFTRPVSMSHRQFNLNFVSKKGKQKCIIKKKMLKYCCPILHSGRPVTMKFIRKLTNEIGSFQAAVSI